MVLNIHRNHKAYLGRGEDVGGRWAVEEGVWREGGGEMEMDIIYLSLHCHHQNDSCIKVGSDGSHVKCFINCEGRSPKTVSTDHNF